MDGLVEVLRSGSLLTRERMRFTALAVLVAFALGYGWLVATAHGGVDVEGRPLGTDFSNFYAAGTLVRDGRPQAAYDFGALYAREQALFGADTQFYGFLYPPFFLLIAGGLARLPYGAALAVWQATTFLMYLGMILAIRNAGFFTLAHVLFRKTGTHPGSSPGQAFSGTCAGGDAAGDRPPADRTGGMVLLLAAAFPAVFINLGHGQNGFLTAALLGGALLALERRPVLAGVLFGLLAYKPQFGLMIPLALLAGGHWRAVAAAAATVALAVVVTLLAFGTPAWDAFLASTQFSRTALLEGGDLGWFKMQSVLAWTRMWGGTTGLGYAAQGTVTTLVGIAIVWLWRSAAPAPIKAAALCIATLLATPYCLDYDMMVLAPAIAFMAAEGLAHGFRPWERSTLAGLWLVPLVTRTAAEYALLPLGAAMMIAGFLVVLQRAAAKAGQTDLLSAPT